jgi:hypothetical protein
VAVVVAHVATARLTPKLAAVLDHEQTVPT